MTEPAKINPEIELPPRPGQEVAMPQAATSQIGTAVQNDNTRMMWEMIREASRDQTVDVNKMKLLREMMREEEDRQMNRDFDIAMNEAQREMKTIKPDSKNKLTNSWYASMAAFDDAIRDIYTRHGFALTFNEEPTSSQEIVRVTCDVLRAGVKRHYQTDIPRSTKGAKGGELMTDTHAHMSADTYGMRNLTRKIFNLAVGKDDDGNAAGTGFISEAQVKELSALVATIDATLKKAGIDKHVDVAKICKNVGAKDFAGIPVKKYKMLTDALRQWGRQEIENAKRKKK